jgi:hypothetical protein
MLFNRQPRHYNHRFMFVDEHKEKIKAMEVKARRELGMLSPESFNPEDIRGTFSGATKHLKRWKVNKENGHKQTSAGVSFVFIAVLLILWHYLATGYWGF